MGTEVWYLVLGMCVVLLLSSSKVLEADFEDGFRRGIPKRDSRRNGGSRRARKGRVRRRERK